MKRSYVLVALAVAVSAALFGAAKIAASWRPVKVALIDPPDPNGSHLIGAQSSFTTHISERELIFRSLDVNKIFDLPTGQVRMAKKEGIVAGGNGHWEIKGGKTPQLLVRQNAAAERAYNLPAADGAELNAMPPDLYQESAQVAAGAERVEMAVGAHYYRWNTTSRALERNVNCDMENALGNQAIARDGKTLINAGLGHISALSTQTGQFTRHDKLAKTGAEGAYISAFGAYSIYAPPTSNAMKWHVIDCANARQLWQFQTNSYDDPVAFSPDEKWIAIARGDHKIWEIHDARTGENLKTLPLVPTATSGAFSPDGNKLYSVADGVLYRQRAR